MLNNLLTMTVVITVSGAEDPEKMLDQAVNEMQSDLVRLRQASAQVQFPYLLTSSAVRLACEAGASKCACTCTQLHLLSSAVVPKRHVVNM